MRCWKELFQAGSIFHVYNHAVSDDNIFRDENDYRDLLKRLDRLLNLIPVSVIAFCLMPNHFHFILRQDSDYAAYKLINRLFSGYVQGYNRRYRRKGRLLRSPLQHHLVNADKYLIDLIRYIHLNPVKAGFVIRPGAWSYSDYRDWISESKEGVIAEYRSQLFGDSENFKRFVEESDY